MESQSIQRYRFKRLLKTLNEKQGRGTELISLYIPPGRNIFEVGNYLRQEQDQAGNIKDKLTRKNVQTSLEKLVQHLKLYRKTPQKGLVLFCGAIPRGPVRGTEKIEIYVLEPPDPVNSFMYVCDQTFYLEPLEEMARERDIYALLVLDRGGGAAALLKGANYSIVAKVSSDVPPKVSAGGWSQRRYERIREEKVREFFRKLGDRANSSFLPHYDELKGVVIGGPGDARDLFASGDYLDYRLKQKVMAILPTSYNGEQGIRELMGRAESVLKDVTFLQEKRAVDEALAILAKDPGLLAYGLKDVVEALKGGAAEKVIMLGDLDVVQITIACRRCGFTMDEVVKSEAAGSLDLGSCPECGSTSFDVEEKDAMDHIASLAESISATVMIISSETEWGEQLRALGGIVAILRYRASG